MAAMEAEVERQRLEQADDGEICLEASGRKLGRQERIVSKLMAELREEKTRNAAWGLPCGHRRLRDELCGKLAAAAAERARCSCRRRRPSPPPPSISPRAPPPTWRVRRM